MQKAISVIVPIYNGEKYLENTLKSILTQTFLDFELLLINDGSSDMTPQICNEIAKIDSRVAVVHQENKGVSAARNEGIKRAKGKYVCFIDADDYVESNMLEILYKNAIKNDVDISCCGILQKRLDGSTSTKYCTGESVYIDDRNILIENFFTDPIYKEVLYGPYNKIIKTDIVDSVKFNENYKIGEDLLFNFECIEKSRSFYFENKGLYHYIKREDSATTSRFSKKRFDYIYVADILLEKCSQYHKEAYDSALLWVYIHKQNMCRSLCKNTKIKKENLDFYKSCYFFCKKHKKEVWGKLPIKKKLDYFILNFAPILYKVL